MQGNRAARTCSAGRGIVEESTDGRLVELVELSGNCVLITGGATGIGFCLAEELLGRGNEVIICGRREDRLREARRRHRRLITYVCDVTSEIARKALVGWATSEFPELNILVNNAGIRIPADFARGGQSAADIVSEIDVNLIAPIALSALLIPHLKKKDRAAIINVSSGLAFVPLASVPVYSATKAGLHSFTLSLRHQLRKSNVRVIEIIPPTVDTELNRARHDGGTRRGRSSRPAGGFGISPEDAARIAVVGVERGDEEILIPPAESLVEESRENPVDAFRHLNEE